MRESRRITLAPALAAVLLAIAIAYVASIPFGREVGAARAALSEPVGPLIDNDLAGGAVLVAHGLAPGHSSSGTVTVTNRGDAGGAFVLSARSLSDVPSAPAPLSGVLDLLVSDVTPGQAIQTVFVGKLRQLATVAVGSLLPGEARRFRFDVSFPGGRPAAMDDIYQGASSSLTLVWDATATAPATASQPSAPAPPRAVRPSVGLAGAARQRLVRGAVVARVRCGVACRATLQGTVSIKGSARALRLRPKRVTLARDGWRRVRVALSPAARRAAQRALAGRRRITVRLRLRASIGGRVITKTRVIRLVKGR